MTSTKVTHVKIYELLAITLGLKICVHQNSSKSFFTKKSFTRLSGLWSLQRPSASVGVNHSSFKPFDKSCNDVGPEQYIKINNDAWPLGSSSSLVRRAMIPKFLFSRYCEKYVNKLNK